jgi:hypothetical protein
MPSDGVTALSGSVSEVSSAPAATFSRSAYLFQRVLCGFRQEILQFCGTGTAEKSQIKTERPNFREIMLLMTLKRQDLVLLFCFKKTAKYFLDPEPEPKLFQRRNRNRNK